jgi:universal stress protein A
VPIDFSKISQKALDYAVPFAIRSKDHSAARNRTSSLPSGFDLPSDERGVWMRPVKKELDALAKSAVEPEFLREVIVRVGTAFEVITNVARDCQADLIVITTHGYTGLKHVFMGSTAERVVRHAPCPVFVVRKCEHEFV